MGAEGYATLCTAICLSTAPNLQEASGFAKAATQAKAQGPSVFHLHPRPCVPQIVSLCLLPWWGSSRTARKRGNQISADAQGESLALTGKAVLPQWHLWPGTHGDQGDDSLLFSHHNFCHSIIVIIIITIIINIIIIL